MGFIALRMLLHDRAKYLGLVFAIGFSSMLMAHQTSIFVSLMRRTTSQILDVQDAQVWVMDPRVQYVDEVEPLQASALQRVRSVAGVEWAAPFFKGTARARATTGEFQAVLLLGVDDASLVGGPRRMLLGDLDDLRRPDAVVIDDSGYSYMFPGEPPRLGRVLEMNDRRAVLVGICRVASPFQTLPVVYARRSTAVRFVGPERKATSFVVARPAPGVEVAQLCGAIREATGLAAMTRDDFAWRTIRYYLTHTGIPVNFGITVGLAFFVGTVVAGQTFYIFTLENLKQFGALKAIGVTNGQLAAMVLLQALVVGTLGYGLGVGMSAAFFEATKDISHLRGFFMPWQIMVGTGVAVVVIVLLASLLSLRRVVVLEPAVVFRGA